MSKKEGKEMRINVQLRGIRCHYCATKKRDWLRWGRDWKEGEVSKIESFRMFMKVIRGNFRVTTVIFWPMAYTDRRGGTCQNS